MHGCKRHRNAKAECQAQHGLRHGHKAFGVRINQRDRQRAYRIGDSDCVGSEYQRKCQQHQHRAQPQRFFNRHRTSGHWAPGSAFDMAIKIPVRHVVDAAPCAAHENSAQREYGQQVPTGKALRRNPQGAQGRPQQEQPARGSIPANEVQVHSSAGKSGGHIGLSQIRSTPPGRYKNRHRRPIDTTVRARYI